MKRVPPDLLPGTLDLLILRLLARESMHGYGIAQRLREVSDDVLVVGESSLYPALQRLLLNDYVRAEWSTSDNNRRARYYTLTPSGRKHLQAERAEFTRLIGAIQHVLDPPEETSHAERIATAACPASQSPFRRRPRRRTSISRTDETRRTDRRRRVGGGAGRARRALGNVTLMREDSRGVWILPWIESIGQDPKYAVPLTRASAAPHPDGSRVLVLAIGLISSLFTAFKAISLTPWPARDPGRVVQILAIAGTEMIGPSVDDYSSFARRRQTAGCGGSLPGWRCSPEGGRPGRDPPAVAASFRELPRCARRAHAPRHRLHPV